MSDENISKKPLTLREKLTVYLIIMLIKVIKPFEWQHQLEAALEEIKECIKEGA